MICASCHKKIGIHQRFALNRRGQVVHEKIPECLSLSEFRASSESIGKYINGFIDKLAQQNEVNAFNESNEDRLGIVRVYCKGNCGLSSPGIELRADGFCSEFCRDRTLNSN